MIRKFLSALLTLFALLALTASLTTSLFVRADEFLEPEAAFRFSARTIDAHTVEARYTIAPGYYLYRHSFAFSVEPAPAQAGEAQIPPGKAKNDENFGRVEVYYKEVAIRVPVSGLPADGRITLRAKSQGCADAGVCYPPQDHAATLVLAAASGPAASVPAASTPTASAGPAAAPAAQDETSAIAASLKHAGFWLSLATFFGFGLLLTFTPCVFPMVPILSGIIVGEGHALSRGRALALSLAYVFGMAVTYALAGVAAGLSGTLLASSLQNVWVLSAFAVVFVGLALSMFGFYDIALPSFLESRVSETANHQKRGTLHGVAAMGALSALIVSPCVAAPLAGALLYIGQTGDALLGGAALFALALGMGAPLLVVGVSAGSLLPKVGDWMEAVKKFFGVLLLAVAVWIVSPVIPALAQMLAWAAILVVSAMYLHALDPLPPTAAGWQRFWKGVGVLALIAGAALFLGALAGSRDPLQPLSFLRQAGAATAPAAETKFLRIRSAAELDAALAAEAAGARRPAMLDFYADWCVSCKELERFTFADPRVAQRLSGYLLLQADVTGNSADDQALLKRFGLFGPPGIVFFDGAGHELPDARVVGYQPPEKFLESLARAGA